MSILHPYQLTINKKNILAHSRDRTENILKNNLPSKIDCLTACLEKNRKNFLQYRIHVNVESNSIGDQIGNFEIIFNEVTS
jgi:hypothetical protein